MSDEIEKFIKIGGTIKSAADQIKADLPLNVGEALKASQIASDLGKVKIGSLGDILMRSNPQLDVMAMAERQRQERMEEMGRQAQLTAEHHGRLARAQHLRDNPVLAVFEELQSYIKEFEGSLQDDEIVGARLVMFGQDTKFHIKSLGYSTPCLIHFDGADTEGNRVRLVQNISQLSVLFVAMRLPEGEQKRPIGFIYPKD